MKAPGPGLTTKRIMLPLFVGHAKTTFRSSRQNCPRRLAKKAYKKGLDSVQGNPLVAANVDTSEGEYYSEFSRMLFGDADHGGDDQDMLRKMYAAQCVKDDTMAESIELHWKRTSGSGSAESNSSPLIVHWCGRAHSDRRLGTVERVANRIPGARIAVVSIVTTPEEISETPSEVADFIWYFPY